MTKQTWRVWKILLWLIGIENICHNQPSSHQTGRQFQALIIRKAKSDWANSQHENYNISIINHASLVKGTRSTQIKTR